MAKQSLNLPYLVLSGAVLVTIIVSFVVIWPVIERGRAVQATVVTTQQEVTDKKAFLQTIDRKKTELSANQQHERQLAVVLPADQAVEDLVRIANQTATTAGVTLIQLINDSANAQTRTKALRARGGNETLPEAVVPVSMRVIGSGSYQQLRQFIELLERSPRLMDIFVLDLNRNANNVEQIDFNLAFRAYQHEPVTQANGQ